MTSTGSPPQDRQGLEVLTSAACWQMLTDAAIGRVAFVHQGQPVVLPVNHGVVGHSIVFRTREGAKLSAAVMADAVAFEADGWDVAARTGWSVLVSGVASTVVEREEVGAPGPVGARTVG